MTLDFPNWPAFLAFLFVVVGFLPPFALLIRFMAWWFDRGKWNE